MRGDRPTVRAYDAPTKMQSSHRLAFATALCAALLLAACSRTEEKASTDSLTIEAQPADATPAATDASPAPAEDASGESAAGYIDLPVYPGASEHKDQDMAMSANDGSLTLNVYSTKDDMKRVAEWYKSHLPSSWKGGVMTAGDKSIGTFSNETSDGDQSVIVAADSDGTTRIQLATKHGK